MRIPTAALVLLVAFAATGPALGSGHYDVSADPHVDTPARTVTYDGDDFAVEDLGRVDPGEAVTAEVEAASGDAHLVRLYDADGQRMAEDSGVGPGSYTFQTSAGGSPYAPGTYVLAVEDSGIQAVAPVVVSGYRVSVDAAPGSAEAGETVTVEASVTTVDDEKPIDRVQVVIGDDDDDQRVTLDPQGGGEYAETFALDGFADGDYDLYVVVQGAKQVLGKQEVLGVSDSATLTVGGQTAETTTEESSSDGSDDGSGESGSSGGSTTEGATTTTAGTTTAGTTAAPTTAAGGTTAPTTAGPTTAAGGTTAGPTTDDSVITPNPTTSAPATSSPGQPLGVLPALAALLAAAALARRRR